MTEQLTKQQVIDKVWDHFIVKKQPRALRNGHCVYLDPETGNRCAIGLFMTDPPEKDEDAYYMTADEVDLYHRAPSIADHEFRFLRDLQAAHDDAQWVDGKVKTDPEEILEGFKAKLLKLCDDHDLQRPTEL